jgi:hypothetical protein
MELQAILDQQESKVQKVTKETLVNKEHKALVVCLDKW